jgi:hypothetical protein
MGRSAWEAKQLTHERGPSRINGVNSRVGDEFGTVKLRLHKACKVSPEPGQAADANSLQDGGKDSRLSPGTLERPRHVGGEGERRRKRCSRGT